MTRYFMRVFSLLCSILCVLSLLLPAAAAEWAPDGSMCLCDTKPIRWAELHITATALADLIDADISSYHDPESHGEHTPLVTLLTVLAVRYGGDFKRYKHADLAALQEKLSAGADPRSIAGNDKLFDYYTSVYTAVFGGFIGQHRVWKDGAWSEEYGVQVFSPIAAGWHYSHYDDFGATRSFGYRREHLGHDLMGSVGTPIIAVESGVVEACGWNRFGGWRLGIRSFDGLRYYYYAHLRKGHPYAGIQAGDIVYAGEVIGYMGMTGYSSKEDVNNINVPHLHFGVELIFDPAEKDGNRQIWLDLYEYTRFLDQYRVKTEFVDNERRSLYICIPEEAWD